MNIYIFNLISVLIYAILIEYIPLNRKNKSFLFGGISFFQFFLISILRAETVGTDLSNYIGHFKTLQNYEYSDLFTYPLEYGFIIYNKLLGEISVEPRILIIGLALPILVSFMLYIYKFSNYIWLSVFLFITLGYYTSSFNICRQFIAIAILIQSLRYVEERKFGTFLLYILLATSFHMTAIVFIILYPLSFFRVNKVYFSVALGIAIILAYLIVPPLLNYSISAFYEIYEGDISESTGGYGLFLLLLMVTFGGMLLKPSKISRNDELFFHIMIIACCMQLVSIQFNLFSRVVLYWEVNMIIFIPKVIGYVKEPKIRMICIIIICLFTIFYYKKFVLAESNLSGILPYVFMWE